ncbi:GNAT family N-acetyltransferase [Sedimentibacter sp. zth1]|uniref:GNAT family N-acetyltransferase n=1 Tax=Sedimentibacter sp. zth1 TaxID=2816908 RepID=UPI001A920E10|nr:GNAT family protein [Sedimentibacter sp. zth1]QSX07002.1 GNAT family N-acetyltransferase [Sedimentibacter sp. zth1]
MKIEGNQIILTSATEKDIEFLCRAESDKSLWIYEEDVAENDEKLREKFITRINGDRTFDFIVTIKGDKLQTKIGFVSVWKYCEWRKSWEVGYSILPQFQKKGYGAESLKLLLKFAFEELKAHKVVGMCNIENIGSGKMMSKCGMRLEGIFKEELDWNGKWTDQQYYSILESEHKK